MSTIPSRDELRRKIEQASLRSAKRQYPDRRFVIDDESLDQAVNEYHQALRRLIRRR